MQENTETRVEVSDNKKIRKSVLDYFSRISSDHEATRLKSASILVRHICPHEDTDSPELRYAIARLVRGLGASKVSSKAGYYTTLVALLQGCASVTVDDILQSAKKHLQTGDSKSENGDVYTGQVLAFGALLHSGMFLRASPEVQTGILQQMLAAGKKRSYLTLAATMFVADLLLKIDDTQFRNIVWPVLRLEVFKFWAEQTIDSLYLLTLVLNRYPHVLKDATVKKHFGVNGVYSEENVKPICDILMNIATVSALKHPGYTVISQEVAKSNVLPAFMDQLNNLLLKPNRNRILATGLIIMNVMKSVDALTRTPDILLDNFIKQVLAYYHTQHNSYDKDFQEGMTKVFQCLHECFQNINDKHKVAIIKKLIICPGTLMFEEITKTKVLHQLINSLNEKGIKKLSKLYRGIIAARKGKVVNGATMPWLNTERTYAAQLLVKLLNLPGVQNNIEWKKKQLKFLINVGIIKHEEHSNVGAELSGSLSDIFYRALDLKFTKLEDMRVLLYDLVNHIASLVSLENHIEVLRVPLTPDDFEIWQKTVMIVKKLAKKSKKYVVVFHILFLHMGLQLFKEKDLAIASLKELFLCYERVKRKRRDDNDLNGVNEPEWIEVVMDLFLNLLSHNSLLLRNVIKSVFPHLCKYMTTSSLHQILSTLDPKNESNPLSKNESETDGSESESESDDEIDVEEKETVNDKLRMAVSQALGNDGYKTDDESLDLDDMSDTEAEKLDVALSEAFKQFKPNRGRRKKQSKDDETLTHFRVRVLDLLEIFINSEPSMLSSLEIMLPLLQTLEFTVRDPHQSPLQTRLKHCLKKLTRLKKFASTDEVTPEILSDLLNSFLTKGTKSALILQDMSNEISECCVFLIKCAQIIDSTDVTPKKTKKHLKVTILKIVTDALRMFFNNRDCLIPYPLFKSIFRLNWDGVFALVPALFNYTFDDSTRPFRRSQAFELLKIFYSNRLRSNVKMFKEHVAENEVQLSNKIIGLLDEFCLNPQKTIKERFVYHIFNLLKTMAMKDIKNEEVDWTRLGEKIREYRSYVTLSKDAKLAYNQLCSQLGIPNLVIMKNQVKSEEKLKDAHKAQKRKATTESKKLKKKARHLRAESMSEGFSNSVSFTRAMLNLKNRDETTDHDVSLKHVIVNGTSGKVPKKRLNSESDNKDIQKIKKDRK